MVSDDAGRGRLLDLGAVAARSRQHTGHHAPPYEAGLVIGRRGGRSFVIATIAVFLACFKDRRPFLGPSLADDPAHAATASSGQLASRVDRSDGDHCRGQEHHQDD